MTLNTLSMTAPAKINLTLDVGRKRGDGYHDVQSVMQTVTLADVIHVTPTPENEGILLEVTGAEADGAPKDTSNIVYHAAVRMQMMARRPGGLHIRLEKNIPAQAGLGGGSSDAAATITALTRLWDLALPPRRLTEIAVELGADVPFFLTGGTALVEGLGELVTPLPSLFPAWPLVIVKPPMGISTAWAYRALDGYQERVPGQATATWKIAGSVSHLGNDFEPVVYKAIPEVREAYHFLRAAPERHPDYAPLLCGSGSAIFCRTCSEDAANRLAARIRQIGFGKAWVTETGGVD